MIKRHLLNVTKISLYVCRLLKLGQTKRVWRSKVLDSSVALNRRRLTNEYSLNSFQAILKSFFFQPDFPPRISQKKMRVFNQVSCIFVAFESKNYCSNEMVLFDFDLQNQPRTISKYSHMCINSRCSIYNHVYDLFFK